MDNKVNIKVDFVGSFLLPEELVNARAQCAMGAIDTKRLKAIEDKAIIRLVDDQLNAGLAEVTSGEFRRIQWDKDFWFGLDGVSRERVDSGHIYQPLSAFTDLMRFPDRIAYNPRHPFFDDFSFLYKVTAGRAICRQTVPSPANLYFEILAISDGHPEAIYTEADRLLHDIAEAYNRSILHFHRLGCRHIQIDDTACGMLCDDNYTKCLLQGGVDLISLHDRIIRLINDSITGLPSDLEVSVYLSGGDTIVPEWEFLQFPDNIMPKVLSQVNVDKFFMPFDIGNEYLFEVLRHVPSDKEVALGLADAHSPFAERTDEILHALHLASKFIRPENLSVSTKTGFKLSSYATRGLTYGDQWHKTVQLRDQLNG